MNPLSVDLQAAPLVAKALGRAMGVSVVFGNYSTAFVDGETKTIYLPHLPLELAVRAEKLLWGFIHHESMHLRHTDFSVGEIIASENDLLLKSLENIFEDVRGEAAQIALYPGAERILVELMIELVDSDFFSEPKQDISPAGLVCGLLIRELRSSVLGQTALQKQADIYQELLVNTMGQRFVTRLLAIASEVTSASSTLDCLSLAYRVRQFLEDEKQQDQDQDGDASGDTNQSSDSSGASSDSNGATDSSSGQADASDADSSDSGSDTDSSPEQSGDSSDVDSDSSSKGAAAASDSSVDSSDGSDADSGDDRDEFIDRALSPTPNDLTPDCSDLGDGIGGMLGSEIASGDRPISLPSSHSDDACHRDSDAVTASRSISSRLALQLKRHLEGRRRLPATVGKRGRRLSRRHLHRVAIDDPRVFTRKSEISTMFTSVILLLDVSSSMNTKTTSQLRRVDIARDAVLATSLALDSIRGLDSSVGAFPSHKGNEYLEVLKRFSERSEVVSSRFRVQGRGNTPLPEALLWSMDQFSVRPHGERRILVVATDGEPQDVASSEKLLVMCNRLNIETYGLGIETDAVNTLPFASSESIASVQELCPVLLGMFQRILPQTA